MLRTRLIVGTILAALTAGMLFLDRYFAPVVPIPRSRRVGPLGPRVRSSSSALLPDKPPAAAPRLPGRASSLLVALNWWPLIRHPGRPVGLHGWADVAQGLAAMVLAAFLAEMARFTGPGGSVERIALAVWIVAYLGLLPMLPGPTPARPVRRRTPISPPWHSL